MIVLAPLVGIFAFLFASILYFYVLSKPAGTQKMMEISNAVKEGSMAYLLRQYRTLLPIILILTFVLFFAINLATAISFLLGTLFSGIAGFLGMNVSVRANTRVANAAKKGLEDALKLAFHGGTVTGMAVVGLGLLGVSGLYLLFNDPKLIVGFGFGASLISLFMRVGGGIYTKAADVGADLVGKVEKGIPEDDPRNPAVIADNVGDNVGDCAGMAADLFESYAVTLIAAMLLGLISGYNTTIYPIYLATAAVISSVFGVFFVKLGKDKNIWKALYRGLLASAIFSGILFFVLTDYLLNDLNIFLAAISGILVTLAIGKITEHYTLREKKSVREIAEAAKTGAGTNVITGIAVGLKSTFPTVLVIVLAILVSYYFAGVYGIAIAALSMLSLTGIIVSIDSYGPITDNAGGIAEMSGMSKKVRKITDALDAVGNTTKAVTKGFAIGAAALAALSLFVAYAEESNIDKIDILNSNVVAGLFIGGALPFLFSSYTMRAVGKTAFSVVEEVRYQFKKIKGIMQGRAKPNYARVVDITTRAALKEFLLPGILSVISPIIVGFILGPEALGGLLAGSIVTGFLLAVMMANAGAAWDNAKKYIEEGNFGGKGSDAHKSAVIGDTVGDPFKDTASVSLNPLIKVFNMVALLAAGYITAFSLL
ncbi:MAG: sodium-translocating pyrophosphatase [Candidatus Aenigmatarchaeota archaeon]